MHPDVPEPVPLLAVPPIDETASTASNRAHEQGSEDLQFIEMLYETAGTVLAEGKVTARRTTGRTRTLSLHSYRLEELVLSRALRATVKGEETVVQKAWRLTLTGGPFPVRAMAAVLWIGDSMVGYGREATDLSAITAVTFDEDILVDGAAIAISYGDYGQRTVFPQKLSLGKGNR